MPVRRLLILGGTAEAAALAREAGRRFADRLEVTTSLAGRLTPSRALAGRVRVGGFGGAGGLIDYLRSAGIDLLIDATHPFAEAISRHAAIACEETATRRLVLVRPPWRRGPGDRWEEVGDAREAAALLARIGRRVFLTTGPGSVDAFAGLGGIWFLVRLFAPPPAPLSLTEHRVLVARPPFEVASETALFERHRIDTLVSKQSGGPTDAKLAAARHVGARVVLIRRPPPPPGEIVETVDAALQWLAARL